MFLLISSSSLRVRRRLAVLIFTAWLRRERMEPTVASCGYKTGDIGEGSETVLPGSAMLKIDCRLVYNQNPRERLRLLKEDLGSHGFGDIQVRGLGFIEPSFTRPSAP